MDLVTLALAKKYAASIATGIIKTEYSDGKFIFTLSDGSTTSINMPIPQRGTDYWTEADKQEMKDYIDTQLGDIATAVEGLAGTE